MNSVWKSLVNKITCTIQGHIYVGFDTYSHYDDSTIPVGFIRRYFICSRCSKVIVKDEPDLEVETKEV